jgi:hypothetical protein
MLATGPQMLPLRLPHASAQRDGRGEASQTQHKHPQRRARRGTKVSETREANATNMMRKVLCAD